jgi:hypothetical protein
MVLFNMFKNGMTNRHKGTAFEEIEWVANDFGGYTRIDGLHKTSGDSKPFPSFTGPAPVILEIRIIFGSGWDKAKHLIRNKH